MEEESGRRARTGVLRTSGHQHRRPRRRPSRSGGAQRAAAPGRLAAERGRGAGAGQWPATGRGARVYSQLGAKADLTD